MAKRWRALHRRRARKLQPNYEPWCPSGWESIYSRDYDDDDDFPDYDEWNDMERCSSCGGTGLRENMTNW